MTFILDGGKKFTLKRRFIESAHDGAKAFVHDEISREELVGRSLSHFMDTHWKYLESGYKPRDQDMTFMSNARMLTGPLGLHYGVFSSTLRSQCSEEQHSWWLQKAQTLSFIGCYAQTELGHGSNVRGVRTTATFDPSTEEWVMHTPGLEATKWWATGLYSSTHAAVYAQMILPGGKEQGVHVFLVQLRGPDLKPLPGIEVGEIGAKLGDNDATIGFLRMSQVRIPRRHLMEKRQHVTKEGKYVRHGGKPPAAATPKRAAAAAHAAKPKAAAGGSKAHYITMLKTRVALANTAGGSLAKAATIAARYSCVRQQGFVDTSQGGAHTRSERQIVDYQVQLFRVLKGASNAVAIKLVARALLKLRKEVAAGDEKAAAQLPEVHASAAGLKALTCCIAADGIEDLRRACGGHGYLMNSGIAPLEADFKGPNTTAEGDYVVLLLQTARFLMKNVDAAKRGEELPGLTKCLAPLRDPSFDPVKDGAPAPARSVDELFSLPRLLALFQYRVLVSVSKAHAKLEAALASGMGLDAARNSNARLLYTTAKSHVLYFMLDKFVEEVANVEDPACKAVVHKLCCVFALSDMLEGEQWLGLVDARQAELADAALSRLCAELRPDVIAIVDSFDIPDRVLNSTLGRFDGKVYQALYDAAVSSDLNTSDRPAFFDHVTKYLDTGFLSLANKKQSSAGFSPFGSKL